MESSSDIKITVFGKTDVGLVREHNEDNFLIADANAGLRTSSPEEVLAFPLGPKGALFLVCDGMGGAAAGEVASTMAVESIADDLEAGPATTRERYARRLRRAIESANEKINGQSRLNQSERGMGTTCTAACLVDRKLLVGQIGDSRCYVLRSGQLAQLTKDQSLAWQLIEAGAMTAEEAKSFEHANIILQALGVQDKVDVVLSYVDLCRGDVILVSSDGLHGPVADDEMKAILLAEPDPKKACDALVAKALEREGPDNISVIVARFEGAGLPEPEPNPVLGFATFDPGEDPDDPEPVRLAPRTTSEKTTEEFPIPSDPASPGAMPTDLAGTAGSTPSVSHDIATTQETASRPFLTFVLVTLLAALGGALFLAFQQTKLPDHPAAPPQLGRPSPEPAPPVQPSTSDSRPTTTQP
ncbi:MAG: protein phosphatase 2C domain-containing protein [Deltaproteobacteria bacterium]|nr:protein phosphatase 2C domain-containing protein [Deltaproteobacteria bacterium]